MTAVRSGRVAVFAVLAVVVTAWLPAGAARAHGDLLGTRSPAAGEVLQLLPTEVRLQFTARLAPIDPLVVVRDEDGESVTVGPPVVDASTVAQPLVADGSDGVYTVSWRVVAEDGHPASGSYVFAVGDPAEVAAAVTDPAGAAAPSAVIEPSSAPSDETSSGVPAPGVLAGMAAALAALFLLPALVWRRRSTAGPAAGPATSSATDPGDPR